jgi:hypothetical protein
MRGLARWGQLVFSRACLRHRLAVNVALLEFLKTMGAELASFTPVLLAKAFRGEL